MFGDLAPTKGALALPRPPPLPSLPSSSVFAAPAPHDAAALIGAPKAAAAAVAGRLRAVATGRRWQRLPRLWLGRSDWRTNAVEAFKAVALTSAAARSWAAAAARAPKDWVRFWSRDAKRCPKAVTWERESEREKKSARGRGKKKRGPGIRDLISKQIRG